MRSGTAVTATAGWPLFLWLSPQPAERVATDPALATAADALGATLVVPTIDTADVDALARRLATAGPPPLSPGEAPRWQEAGWWLVPLVALLVALWYSRGWVLA